MKHQRHFEFALMLLLIVILALVSLPFFIEAHKATKHEDNMYHLLSQGGYIIQVMSQDIANVRSNSNTDLISGTHRITITTTKGNAISYSKSGNTLYRTIVGVGAYKLAENVTALSFAYINANGALTTNNSDICYVRVRFSISQNNLSQTFSDNIALKNVPC